MPELAFLDEIARHKTDQDDQVCLASFPRSGNTMVRAYVEKITGIITGSDCDISKKLNLDLMLRGLHGEGLVDETVWLVKTHYPERFGKSKFYAQRCVMCVRNPMDAMTSLYHMVGSSSHHLSIQETFFTEYPDVWAEFIEQEISVWKDFHEFWLKCKIPTLFVRFEDILARPREQMTKVIGFLLNKQDLSGTYVESLIELATKEAAP